MIDLASLDVMDPALYAAGRPEHNGLPLDLYDYLRAERPCYRQQLTDPGFIDWTWVVTRYPDVVAVTMDDRRFTATRGTSPRSFDPNVVEQGGKASLLTMDGEEHHRQRRIVARGFTPAVLVKLEESLRVVTGQILDRALPMGTFDFVEEVARPLPMRAICDLLGVPDVDRPQIVKWADMITAPTDPELSGGLEGMMAAAQGIWDYTVELAAMKRGEPAEDLVSKVVAAHGLEVLNDDELMSMVLLLVVAGNETTRNNISHGMHALIRNPEQWRLLRERTDEVIDTAVEEILRYSCAAVGFSRYATTEVQIHGNTVRPGELVTFVLAAANFDPEVFDRPRQLDLTRDPNPHVTFGRGPHFCLGNYLARLETKIMFEELARRVETVELAGDVVYARDALLRGCHRLPVTVHL